jgi:hypothetical protein
MNETDYFSEYFLTQLFLSWLPAMRRDDGVASDTQAAIRFARIFG